MHLLTILVLALSSNLDNIGVGLAYGTRKIRLPFLSNLLIAVITSVGTLATMLMGKDLTVYFVHSRLANYLGSGIIIIAGLYMIFGPLRQQGATTDACFEAVQPQPTDCASPGQPHWPQDLARLIRDPQLADRDYSGSIELGEAAVLALALTLNNLASGFAAGMLGLNFALTTGAILVLSLLTFLFGIWLGLRYTSRILGNWAGPAAGIMMILIGVYELFS